MASVGKVLQTTAAAVSSSSGAAPESPPSAAAQSAFSSESPERVAELLNKLANLSSTLSSTQEQCAKLRNSVVNDTIIYSGYCMAKDFAGKDF